MRQRFAIGSLVMGLALLAPVAPVDAHHGAATFETGRELTLKGTVTEWIWANPHCFLRFDARVEPAKNGEPVARVLSVVLADGRTLVAAAPQPAVPAP